MKRFLLATAAAVATLAFMGGSDAWAGGKPKARKVEEGAQLSEHPKAQYYRKRGPQVRGFVQRRGGYSYYSADSINTYGSSRTLYGGSFLYRDPLVDRQTRSGPFDHGFFFDSGVAPRGGDSPNMH